MLKLASADPLGGFLLAIIAALTMLSFSQVNPAHSQLASPIYRLVTGRVIDSLSGKPLQGVSLYFEGQLEESSSDRDGRFVFEKVKTTDTMLIARRIGYVPARIAAPLSPSDAKIDLGTVQLRQVATQLDLVAVEAEEVHRYPSLEGFYRRKNLGRAGFFMTPDEIARASARKTSNLLERSAKVVTACNDVGVWGKRGVTGPTDCKAQNSRQIGNLRCELEVWIDGTRAEMMVDDIPVRSILAIEVYNGPASTPPEFGSGFCGVVGVWTKSASDRAEGK